MVTQVVITNEDHKVWRGYMAKGQYDTALLYCRDLGQREQVLRAQADYYFDCKQSELAVRGGSCRIGFFLPSTLLI